MSEPQGQIPLTMWKVTAGTWASHCAQTLGANGSAGDLSETGGECSIKMQYVIKQRKGWCQRDDAQKQ